MTADEPYERTEPTGVTYQEARETVRAKLEPDWKWGTFGLDDRKIVENDEFWVFAVGGREFIVDKADGRMGSRASVEVALDPAIRSKTNPDPTLT
jgi:hypothetical protein